MHACLRLFGEAAGEIGLDKPLGQNGKTEALQPIEPIVTGWTKAERLTTNRRSIRRCEGSPPMKHRRCSWWPSWNRHQRRPLSNRLTRSPICRTAWPGRPRRPWRPETLRVEYTAAPVDPNRGHSGHILRVFEVGHMLEDLAVRRLRMAGFDLPNLKANGDPFGLSVGEGRIKRHVVEIITAAPPELGLSFPMLWKCKTIAEKHWRDCAKSGERSQSRSMPRRRHPTSPP